MIRTADAGQSSVGRSSEGRSSVGQSPVGRSSVGRSSATSAASASAEAPEDRAAMMRLVGLYRRTFTGLLAQEPWVVKSGAKPNTYGVLSVVGHRGAVSQREVCDVLGVHPSDMVEIIDIVEREGWVERRRDPDDRRRYRLTLTAAGQRTLARYDALAARAEDVVLEPLTDAERRRLLDLVVKVVGPHS